MLQLAKNEYQEVNVKAIPLPPSNVQDKDIIKRIKNGDVNAYGSIMRRYNQRMFALLAV
ncbi:MAG: hypothetical protein HOM14_03015 [Gammaproteobacteria bacterium]|jgi:hypothetical protein|nr:hypothetical protein [Gammaproteobacteria bacterium]MBT3722937.1 hypothetical protein [Gammaproteobacteria bacterium]MBT4075872.1 hypothetical protein [Gammaproteobacteria bacterium]MBT4193405.1 hypothetical protein [Gammaproteobacteria bacterium]MBT4449054.1 hypothetical protein [Gammaproteobacteria bacterium]